MARSDGPFEVIQKIGSNAYKLDMAVSATFNIGDLSPYAEDTVEDALDLRSNHSKEGKVDVGACPQGHVEDGQGQRSQEQGSLASQIQALFSFPSSSIYTDFENHFKDGPVVMIRHVLLCWTP